jgi:hypothetical protein
MNLTLPTGRRITLASLEQFRTYDGLLAGKPDARTNKRHIEDLFERACQHTVAGGNPVLLQPSQEALNGHLPGVSCIAVFESGELARKGSEPYSSLTVAWFQNSFALPIDASVDAQIRAIDWEHAGTDWMP